MVLMELVVLVMRVLIIRMRDGMMRRHSVVVVVGDHMRRMHKYGAGRLGPGLV